MIAILQLCAQPPSTAAAGAKLTLEYEAKGVFFEGPMWDPKGKKLYFTAFKGADAEGNLYLTGRGGVWAVNPEGKSLGLIPVKEFASNVTFGGADGKTLFSTCQDRLYSVPMKVKGALFGR